MEQGNTKNTSGFQMFPAQFSWSWVVGYDGFEIFEVFHRIESKVHLGSCRGATMRSLRLAPVKIKTKEGSVGILTLTWHA